MSNNKLKILCLHGLRHNSELLKKSMERIIKKLVKFDIEFYFYDSPIKYTNDNDTDNDYRQWWTATKENVYILEKFDTIELSITNLKNKWDSDKYDGLLGFSQGGEIAQIFAYQIQNKIIKTYEPKFLILVSSIPITDINYNKYYQYQLNYKTLIISGSKDTLVSMDKTLSLVKYFKEPSIIIHRGGHYFSTTSETYYRLKKFLQEFKLD